MRSEMPLILTLTCFGYVHIGMTIKIEIIDIKTLLKMCAFVLCAETELCNIVLCALLLCVALLLLALCCISRARDTLIYERSEYIS